MCLALFIAADGVLPFVPPTTPPSFSVEELAERSLGICGHFPADWCCAMPDRPRAVVATSLAAIVDARALRCATISRAYFRRRKSRSTPAGKAMSQWQSKIV